MTYIDAAVQNIRSIYSLRFVNGEWIIYKNMVYKSYKDGQEALQELRRLQFEENKR